MDINEVAGLLHIEEKLRAHGDKFKHMLKAVRDKLDVAEKEQTPKEEKHEEKKDAKEDASKEAPKKDEGKADTPRSGPGQGPSHPSQTSSTVVDRRL